MSDSQKKFLIRIRRKKRLIKTIQFLIIFFLLLIWQYTSDCKILNPFIFSSPIKICKTIYQLFINGELITNILVTIKEVFISFILGFVISLVIASLLYSFNILYRIFDPFITMLNSLPKVAIGPLFIIWCGANTNSIIIMALLTNVIVSIITIYTGFVNTDNNLCLLFKSFRANNLQTLFLLVIPNAFGSIISSLKLNISLSFIGVIMGEFLVSKCGIGYLIIYGTQVFNLDLVLSGVFILIILSYFFYKPIQIIEKKIK